MKGVLKKIILFIVLALIFLWIQPLVGNPLFSSFSPLYTFERAYIESQMLPDGTMEVHETITYRMRKPFRGVFREIPPARYVTIDDAELWTENVPAEYIEWEYRNEWGFSAGVWLVPFGSALRLDPRSQGEVVLHVHYRARYVLENGPDTAQVFRQFWGAWDSWAKNVERVFEFPENVTIEKVYTHPSLPVDRKDHHFIIRAQYLPPQAIAEVRFVAQPTDSLAYAAENPTLTLSAIEAEEQAYARRIRGIILLWVGVLGVFIALWVFVYLLLGREPEVDYAGFYERELPYNDPPDVVNAAVKQLGSSCDDDDVAAMLLHLYHLDLIDFPESEQGKAILLKQDDPPRDLPPTEKTFFLLLKEFSVSRVFHFERLRKDLEKLLSKAQRLNKLLTAYQKEVLREVARRRYFYAAGNVIAKVLAFFAMLSAIAAGATTAAPEFAHIALPLTILSGALFFGGGGILFARRDLFGRFTKEGRTYYLRWQSFARFVSDYSLLAERPPQSVVLWEKYLIYATALGLGETASRHLQRLIPKEVIERESSHPFFFSPYVFLPGRSFTSLSSQATTTALRSSSGGGGGFRGGFGGGAGGFGGGSGGGRGGAF
ncbi:MAG: DUF2207 family protein [Candidatus Caldatribacteriaceae bacterium]